MVEKALEPDTGLLTTGLLGSAARRGEQEKSRKQKAENRNGRGET
jgi:hypothetical protein